jgi:hypothetical protein
MKNTMKMTRLRRAVITIPILVLFTKAFFLMMRSI